ncbi:MAG: transposase [Brasilonema octagenarum HA4186-MV1]|jgi:putative transposase|uniref:Transposase n=2 Tax=Brasilonema TaxID=383614 RepID=A0A856MM07_9CYAN|nr:MULTISPECIES: RNA-guided endonuclease TnpB family protein [Brasilonema]MBW4628155.1 transposase [Brasilonema octagenarum HA4186-MV1]NMF67021.1 transposase [Brasilonema octagenarum UFV-OR1]QDL10571.1 transposase [Brasilonema sennae CENA114]QDL16914.1 transposase [Brasilonema octagenarum UFV-E1]
MLLSIKTKLKLTVEQKTMMSKHAGIARFTYNWGLATWKSLYQDGFKPNKYLLKKFFNNSVKTQLEWIKEKGICQKITQYAFDQLGAAYDRFFKGLGGYPKFKKKGQNDSFTIDASGKPIPVGGVRVKLPTIGWVKTYEGLPHTTTAKLSISRIADDWYIAFAYEVEVEPTPKFVEIVGVDLGIKELATLSTGVVFPNPKAYKKNIQKLKRLSKAHSRKNKSSNNRHKSKIKLAKHHARVSNIRKDSLHKVTHYLCKNHAVIVIEDLNVSGMMQNHKLAQSIADCGFHEFKRQIEYKSKKFGSKLVLADKWYPSSKTCSRCGGKKDSLSLSERVYSCEHCGYVLDRDLNAAINLSHCSTRVPQA